MSERSQSQADTPSLSYASFDEFYEARYDAVIGMLHRRGAGQQAEDIAQETFAKLFAKFDDYQGETHNLNALATTAALNALIDSYRRDTRRKTIPVGEADMLDGIAPTHEADPSHIVTTNELFATILDKLPEHQVPVFQLLAAGYTKPEISKKLSMPEGTIGSQIHRGRKALKAAGIHPAQ